MSGLLPRRTWLQLLAVLAAAPGPQQPQQPQPAPQGITLENLQHALKLIGIQMTEDQQAMMLPGINRALAQYASLRQIPVPLDTEPAFRFSPLLPGKPLRMGPARFRPSRRAAPRRSSPTPRACSTPPTGTR